MMKRPAKLALLLLEAGEVGLRRDLVAEQYGAVELPIVPRVEGVDAGESLEHPRGEDAVDPVLRRDERTEPRAGGVGGIEVERVGVADAVDELADGLRRHVLVEHIGDAEPGPDP